MALTLESNLGVTYVFGVIVLNFLYYARLRGPQ